MRLIAPKFHLRFISDLFGCHLRFTTFEGLGETINATNNCYRYSRSANIRTLNAPRILDIYELPYEASYIVNDS